MGVCYLLALCWINHLQCGILNKEVWIMFKKKKEKTYDLFIHWSDGTTETIRDVTQYITVYGNTIILYNREGSDPIFKTIVGGNAVKKIDIWEHINE
jgi:hypothetical protein